MVPAVFHVLGAWRNNQLAEGSELCCHLDLTSEYEHGMVNLVASGACFFVQHVFLLGSAMHCALTVHGGLCQGALAAVAVAPFR